ncbi:MAG: hypothetical protein SVM79_06110 [Chloroflexota bacterium]|nr:hypothetical protein [Chloroflexota bacterium]
MKVPNGKGIANHTGPESCVADRKVRGEALTRVRAGWAIEPRNQGSIEVPTFFCPAEGNTDAIVIAREYWASRGRRTHACTHAPRTGPGRSYALPPALAERVGKSKDRSQR